MVKRMLIEATHPEETRVVVLDGTRLEEFDVETSTKKQIKGNIYLAKVVRVEPSLQAAFVDYGGNRHGFLAFSEIHPDYYQIPVADRERLMAEVNRQEEEAERQGENRNDASRNRQHDHHDHHGDHQHGDGHDGDHAHDTHGASDHDHESDHGDAIPLAFIPPAITSTVEISPDDETAEDDHSSEASEHRETDVTENTDQDSPAPVGSVDETSMPQQAEGDVVYAPSTSEQVIEGTFTEVPATPGVEGEDRPQENKSAGVETVGGDEEEEAAEDKQRRRFVASRHYKIQEVIKRRQIMLIQVVKEERGNKGAALTTYLSLAGRYCVLMPNSPRGGGVSRKITSAQDRRRLKSILGDLELPKNMAVILRTAGAERNKAEIKRDYEYLQRTWNSIREVTMTSRAPALIHEEASLIKRAIRDIYSRDIDEIWVEGEEGYKVGKEFMKMLTPSHAKKVQRYKDDLITLFHRYQVESQMEAINSPTVQLRSGGSIVFAQTEALVAIDVNSGRATKERHIEETAYKTNMEAADEIARQLRLRDLAGLIVIDFIDMEDNRNNHAVERRLKEALKADRARIQVGRISHFGLLELSRQRLRPSLIEANFRTCSHCGGVGLVRSTESAAVHSLRMLEEEGVRQRSSEVTITVHPDVALYLLNYKRDSLASIEGRYGLRIFVLGDASLIPPNSRLDRVKAVRALGDESSDAPPHRHIELPAPVEAEPEEAEAQDEPEAEAVPSRESAGHRERSDRGRNERDRGERDGGERDGAEREGGGRKRRRRRRRRGGEPREGQPAHGGGEFGNAAPEGGENTSVQPADDTPYDQSQQVDGAPEGQPGDNRPQQGRDEPGRKGRRRGRRGGRRRRRGGEHGGEQGGFTPGLDGASAPQAEGSSETWPRETSPDETHSAPAPRHEQADSAPDHLEPLSAEATSAPTRFFRALKEGMPWRRNEVAPTDGQASAPEPAPAPPSPPPAPAPSPVPSPVQAEPQGPARKGWWNQET